MSDHALLWIIAIGVVLTALAAMGAANTLSAMHRTLVNLRRRLARMEKQRPSAPDEDEYDDEPGPNP